MRRRFFFFFCRSNACERKKKKDRKKKGGGNFFFFPLFPSLFLTDAEANRHATPTGIRAIPTANRIAAACSRVGRPSQLRSSCWEKRESFFFWFCFFRVFFLKKSVSVFPVFRSRRKKLLYSGDKRKDGRMRRIRKLTARLPLAPARRRSGGGHNGKERERERETNEEETRRMKSAREREAKRLSTELALRRSSSFHTFFLSLSFPPVELRASFYPRPFSLASLEQLPVLVRVQSRSVEHTRDPGAEPLEITKRARGSDDDDDKAARAAAAGRRGALRRSELGGAHSRLTGAFGCFSLHGPA